MQGKSQREILDMHQSLGEDAGCENHGADAEDANRLMVLD